MTCEHNKVRDTISDLQAGNKLYQRYIVSCDLHGNTSESSVGVVEKRGWGYPMNNRFHALGIIFRNFDGKIYLIFKKKKMIPMQNRLSNVIDKFLNFARGTLLFAVFK